MVCHRGKNFKWSTIGRISGTRVPQKLEYISMNHASLVSSTENISLQKSSFINVNDFSTFTCSPYFRTNILPFPEKGLIIPAIVKNR